MRKAKDSTICTVGRLGSFFLLAALATASCGGSNVAENTSSAPKNTSAASNRGNEIIAEFLRQQFDAFQWLGGIERNLDDPDSRLEDRFADGFSLARRDAADDADERALIEIAVKQFRRAHEILFAIS